jgi:hypothetical protein
VLCLPGQVLARAVVIAGDLNSRTLLIPGGHQELVMPAFTVLGFWRRCREHSDLKSEGGSQYALLGSAEKSMNGSVSDPMEQKRRSVGLSQGPSHSLPGEVITMTF